MDNKEIRKAVDPLEGVVRKTMQQEGGLLELKQPECEPLELDCSSDLVPAHSGHKATVMADGNTMTRYGYHTENVKNFNNAISTRFELKRKRPDDGSGSVTTMIIGCKFRESELGEEGSDEAAFS